MLYSWVLYGRFGINIFDYSEIGDFLLAGFKNHVAFLSAGLLSAMGAALLFYRASAERSRLRAAKQHTKMWWEEFLRREAESRGEEIPEEERLKLRESVRREAEMAIKRSEERWLELQRRATVTIVVIIVSTIVFSSLILPYFSATKTASFIKHGEHPAVDVRYRSFSGSAGQVTEPDLSLIGATQKAVFFYDVNDKHTLVIPQSQIVAIEVPE